jgi:hypothetical protein
MCDGVMCGGVMRDRLRLKGKRYGVRGKGLGARIESSR